jgi:aspartate aminotransferase-like enzyme
LPKINNFDKLLNLVWLLKLCPSAKPSLCDGGAASPDSRARVVAGAPRAQTGQDAIKNQICRLSFMGHFDRYDALSMAELLEEALKDCGLEERGWQRCEQRSG